MAVTNEHRSWNLKRTLWLNAGRAALAGLALIPIGFAIDQGVTRLSDPHHTCELECLYWVVPSLGALILICWALLRVLKVPLASLVTAVMMLVWVVSNGGALPVLVSCVLMSVTAAIASMIATYLRVHIRRSSFREDRSPRD
jgi:hypothetical protein